MSKKKNVALSATQNPINKKILVHFVLDETGSMNPVRDATINGFNEYINGLKQDKNNEYYMSLTKFDSLGIKNVYSALKLSKVPDLSRETYSPGSTTNLNDAIGHSILVMDKAIENDSSFQPLMVIMTDGEENASVEFTYARIQEMIEERKKKSWTINFLGANIDVQKVSKSYAISTANAKAYSVNNMKGMMRGMAASTIAYGDMLSSGASIQSATDSFFSGSSDWTQNDDNNINIVNNISLVQKPSKKGAKK